MTELNKLLRRRLAADVASPPGYQASIEVDPVANNAVSAVVFVRSLRHVAPFYREVLGAKTVDRSDEHESLECQGFRLLMQQIPAALAASIEISTPPKRREQSAVRLDFPTADIERARASARRLGGHVDDEPPPWARRSGHIYLGYDPEGNVIGLMPANAPPGRMREE